jgi:hypothetical protein
LSIRLLCVNPKMRQILPARPDRCNSNNTTERIALTSQSQYTNQTPHCQITDQYSLIMYINPPKLYGTGLFWYHLFEQVRESWYESRLCF